MDRRERIRNDLVAIQALLKSWQSDIATALPGIYKGAGEGNQTANVQPTIRGKLKDQKGDWRDVDMPMCLDCPIMWPGAGGFQLTFPIADGDEGLIVFSQRCIDAWWQSGGVQSQTQMRMHDLSDGFFIPAQLSQAKAPSTAASSSTAQLRSLDGQTYIELAAGNIANIKAPGGLNITGNVVVTGGIALSGQLTGIDGAPITGNLHMAGSVLADSNVQATGNVTAGGISLNSHVHGGVQPGGGSTSGPT